MSAINGYISHIRSAETVHRLIDITTKGEEMGRDGTSAYFSNEDGLLSEKTADALAGRIVQSLHLAKDSVVGLTKNIAKTMGRLKTTVDGSNPIVFQLGLTEVVDFSGWDGSTLGLVEILKSIDGSFALAIYDKESPSTLYLATTTRPLHLEYDGHTLFFSTRPLSKLGEKENFDRPSSIPNIEPYTLTKIEMSEKDGVNISQYSLWRQQEPKTAVVVSTGGIETRVTAQIMQKAGYMTSILQLVPAGSLDNSEEEYLKELESTLGIKHDQLHISRNHITVLARVAAVVQYAQENACDIIAIGSNLEEGPMPEEQTTLLEMIARLLPYACAPQERIQMVLPLYNLTCKEIKDLAQKLEQPTPDV